jgi:hypothetical protein
MPVILATQEADIRRILVWSQSGPKDLQTHHKKMASGVAQAVEVLGSNPSVAQK